MQMQDALASLGAGQVVDVASRLSAPPRDGGSSGERTPAEDVRYRAGSGA